jgi:hypothetical protein
MSEGRHALGEEPAVIAVTELLVESPGGIPGQMETVSLTWHDRQHSRQRLVSD